LFDVANRRKKRGGDGLRPKGEVKKAVGGPMFVFLRGRTEWGERDDREKKNTPESGGASR